MGENTYIKDFSKWQKEFEFFIPVRIRFSETDMFGHVNNVSAFIYFEEARIEFFKAHDLFMDFSDPKTIGVPVVADLQCDYRRQLFFGDHIKLYVKANRIGRTSLDLHYMAVNEKEEVCLTGRGRIVYIDQHTGKPLPLTDEIKRKLAEGTAKGNK